MECLTKERYGRGRDSDLSVNPNINKEGLKKLTKLFQSGHLGRREIFELNVSGIQMKIFTLSLRNWLKYSELMIIDGFYICGINKNLKKLLLNWLIIVIRLSSWIARGHSFTKSCNRSGRARFSHMKSVDVRLSLSDEPREWWVIGRHLMWEPGRKGQCYLSRRNSENINIYMINYLL